jgi:hypothetical protein
MSDKIENFSNENFSGQNLSGQSLSAKDQGTGAGRDQKSPGAAAKSAPANPEGSDGNQREYSGQCGHGVCSLNWKPLRPAA